MIGWKTTYMTLSQWSCVKWWRKLCAETKKKVFSNEKKTALRKIFRHFLRIDFFMLILLLISFLNYSLVQWWLPVLTNSLIYSFQGDLAVDRNPNVVSPTERQRLGNLQWSITSPTRFAKSVSISALHSKQLLYFNVLNYCDWVPLRVRECLSHENSPKKATKKYCHWTWFEYCTIYQLVWAFWISENVSCMFVACCYVYNNLQLTQLTPIL